MTVSRLILDLSKGQYTVNEVSDTAAHHDPAKDWHEGGATLSGGQPQAPAAAPPAEEVFDLGDFAAAQTSEMTVINPITKMPTTWVWTFAGPGHPDTVSLTRRLGMKAAAEANATEKAWRSGREPKIKDTSEQIEDNVLRVSGRALNFTPAKINGQDLRFSRAEAHRILKDPDFGWLWIQAWNFTREDDAFIKGSPRI
jgi:hypothetical protein